MTEIEVLRVNILETLGKDLSNRKSAADLRNKILEHVSLTNGITELDFVGVRTLCESVADELLAVLAVLKGPEWFRKHVSVFNLKPSHLDVVVTAYTCRKERGI